MKKLISILSVAALCLLMAACASDADADKSCESLKSAITAGNKDDVAKIAAELYSKKADCNAENLAMMAVAYEYLAEQEMQGANDPANLADFIEKALDCYGAATALDPDATADALKQAGKENFASELDKLKAQLEQAQLDEQALIDQINS